jgi:hypothetical protein
MAPKPREVNWRRMELLRCGFPRALAARVARDERYDLHQVIELVESGCTPALAVRILPPVDGSDPLSQASACPSGEGE